MGVNVVYRTDKRAWYVKINHNKKRKAIAFGQDEDAARAAAKKIKEEIKLGALNIEKKKECPTLREFAKTYFDESTVKKATNEQRKELFENHIVKLLGDVRVDEITPDHVKAMIIEARKRLAASSTEAGPLRTLSVILTAAKDAKHITTANPCERMARFIKPDAPKTDKVEYLTREQSAELLDAIRAVHGETWYAFFLCLARTGMRVGEAIALQWHSVEFDRARIFVRRNWNEEDGWTTPKNHQKRYVDMSDQLAETLLSLQAQHADNRGPALVFRKQLRKEDRRMRYEQLTYNDLIKVVWNPTVESLKGIDGRITPHILRHTFASQLISDGRSISYVSRQLGHASISITHDIYGHLIPSDDRSAVNSLDEVQPRRNLRVASSRNSHAARVSQSARKGGNLKVIK